MNSEDEIARTLARAGARRSLSERMTGDVRALVEKSWRDSVAARVAQRRRRRWMQAAAGVTLGAGIALLVGWQVHRPNAPSVGVFLASRGSVDIRASDNARVAIGGMTLGAGTRIQTGGAGQALLTMSETSVRVGPSSRVTLARADQIRLEAGKIYLDFGDRNAVVHELNLETPFGKIEHLGTQFQVDVKPQGMTVAVREGHVRLLTRHGEQLIGMGEAADVGESGVAHMSSVPGSGESWAWTTALVPDFPIEGRTLVEFLDWYARETGKRIKYTNVDSMNAAHTTRLSGSIAGLSPDGALQVILTSTQFKCDVLENGDLRLTMPGGAHAKLLSDGMDQLQSRL